MWRKRKMETKDWILLILPIIANGIMVFTFQKVITIKIEKFNKKSSIRDEVIILFWKKLQCLNEVFIQTNISVRTSPNTLAKELEKIKNSVFEIVQYYDTNKYDLKIYSDEYKCWEKSWNKFVGTLAEFSNLTLTKEMQMRLVFELQSVKEKTQDLINIVRKKY